MSTNSRHPNLLVATVLCAIALTASVVVARLAWVGWDASAFVSAGDRFVSAAAAPKDLKINKGIGYDGQFYYRLALDPFSSKKVEFGIELDQPARRQQRILYPFLAWAFSAGGRPSAVPLALLLINCVAVILIAWAGAVLAKSIGRSPVAGLLFALVPGVIVSVSRDTAEALAVLLSLLFLILARRGMFAWATAALTAAVLTRETTILFALGLLAALVWTRRTGAASYALAGKRVPRACPLVPIGAYVAWQSVLWARWGRPPIVAAGGRDLGAPIFGLIRAVSGWASRGSRVLTLNVLFATAAIAFLIVVFRSLHRTRAAQHERIAFILGVVLVFLFRANVWFNFTSFLRALAETSVLGLVILMEAHPTRMQSLGEA